MQYDYQLVALLRTPAVGPNLWARPRSEGRAVNKMWGAPWKAAGSRRLACCAARLAGCPAPPDQGGAELNGQKLLFMLPFALLDVFI